MAYRDLVVGDDVKVSHYGHDLHGHFGKVTGFGNDGYVTVDLNSWRGAPCFPYMFHSNKLLLSNGNPYNSDDYIYSDDEEEEMDDQIVMRSLLERVSKLEKEILDMKSQRQYN